MVGQLSNPTGKLIPENEYIPFTIAKPNGKGQFKTTQNAHVHYANVDSGAQVNCAYSDLLRAFPALRRYFREEKASVVGIGGTANVLGVLENVPLHLGVGPVNPRALVRVDFRVIEGRGYSLILGRQFLLHVRGLIDLHNHKL